MKIFTNKTILKIADWAKNRTRQTKTHGGSTKYKVAKRTI